MGRRAHVQIKQPEYSVCEFTDWAQSSAAAYLDENGINVFTGNNYDSVEYADHWEIEIPWNFNGKGYAEIQIIIDDLRAHPEKIHSGEYGDSCGKEFASLLEEGLEAAKKNGYDYIFIDWF